MRDHLDKQVGRDLEVLTQRRHSVFGLQPRLAPARIVRAQRLRTLVRRAEVRAEAQGSRQGQLLLMDQRRTGMQSGNPVSDLKYLYQS